MISEPAERAIAFTLKVGPRDSAVTRSAGSVYFAVAILGLTPQALCWHPLRRLKPDRCRFLTGL